MFWNRQAIEVVLAQCDNDLVVEDVRRALQVLESDPNGCEAVPVRHGRTKSMLGKRIAELPHGFILVFVLAERVPPIMRDVIRVEAFVRRVW